MKQLKLWVLGLSMVLAGCQTTSHLSALKPQTAEAYSRFVDQPFAQLKKQHKKPVVALVLGSGGARGYVNQQVNNLPLEKMKIPMYVVATELKHGTKTVFNYGNTGQAVRASASIPSMFVPTKIGKSEYVDGGLVSPVPVEVARDLGADVIIAVDILAQPIYTETSNVWGLFNQNINIMQGRLAAEELQYADVVIQPDLREKAHIFDVKGREATMRAGVEAANAKLSDIQFAIDEKIAEQNLSTDGLSAQSK